MIKLFFLVVFTILFYFFVACAKLMSVATNTVANSFNSRSTISEIYKKTTLADNIFLEIFNIIKERKVCPYFYQNTIVEFVMVVEVYFLFMYIHLTKMGIDACYDGTYRNFLILPIKEFAKKKGISYFPRKINKGMDLCAYDFYTLENLIECFEDRCNSYSKVKEMAEICDVDDKFQKANMEFSDSLRYVSEMESLLKKNILNNYSMNSEICEDIDFKVNVDLFIEIEIAASMFAQVISNRVINI